MPWYQPPGEKCAMLAALGGSLSSDSSRWRFRLLALLHLLGCLYYLPPREIFSGEPVLTGDYTHHFVDAQHLARSLHRGSFLGYSTRAAAGYPTGLVGLVNNKPFGLVLALTPERHQAIAFNLTVLLLLWAFPPLAYAAARRFGEDRAEAAAAMLLAMAAWYGSTLFRLFWRGGSGTFLAASGVALFGAGLLHERWTRKQTGASVAGPAAAMALVPWIHPLAAVVALAGAGASWLLTVRERGLRAGELCTIAAVVFVANVPWAAAFWAEEPLRRSLDYGVYLGGVDHLLFDSLRGPLHLGSGPRDETAVLGPLCLAAGAAVWSRGGQRAAALCLTAAVLALLAYGGHALGLDTLQPYRFAMPAAAVLAVVAAPIVAGVFRGAGSWPASAIAVIALLLLFDRVRIGAKASDYLGAGLGESDAWALGVLRAQMPAEDWRRAGRVLAEGDWIADPVPGRARARRIAYSFTALELYLDADFLGAPLLASGAREEAASFWQGRLLGREIADYDGTSFLAICDRYDIAWVLTMRPATAERIRSFAQIRSVAERGRLALFAVDRAPSRVLRGAGRAWSDGGNIVFEADRAEPVLLSYHWMPGLSAAPAAAVAPAEERPGSPSSFIEIRPAAPGRYRIALQPPVGMSPR